MEQVTDTEYEPWAREQARRPRIYVATSGRYSDYRIVGVYTQLELAAQAGDDVEEWLLDDDTPITEQYALPAEPRWCWCMRCRVLRSGEVDSETLTRYEHRRAASAWGKSIVDAASAPYSPLGGPPTLMVIEVQGYNKERVEKEYHDRIAKARAEMLDL